MYQEYYPIFDNYHKAKAVEIFTDVINRGELKRLITDFQILSYKDKLLQYYFTSNGVKFGGTLEEIVKFYLTKKGANFNLNRREVVNGHDCDQIFTYGDKVVLIEQKVRDDHDSSKKRGQVDNYLEKKKALIAKFQKVISCSWFIDDLFLKNKKYYKDILKEEVVYGKEIEDFLAKVFEDDRCSGMFLEIKGAINAYRNIYSEIDIFDNFHLDYFKLQPKGVWELLIALENKPELEQLFFAKGLDRKQLLDYLRKKKVTEYTKKAIAFLEEKNDR